MLTRAVVSRSRVYRCFIIPLATLLAVIGLMVVLRVAAPAVLLSDIALAQGGGNPISYTITGTIWNDLNDNSVLDAGEVMSGIADVKIFLYREISGCVAEADTNSDGIYTFTEVITGDYQIVEAYGRPSLGLNYTATFTATEVAPCDPHSLANDPLNYASNTPNVQWITLNDDGSIANRASPSLWPGSLTTVDFGDEEANPFVGCQNAYQIKGVTDDLKLFELDMLSAELKRYPSVANNTNYYHINSIGFNRLDNFIYGCERLSPYEFTRIDVDGDLTRLTGTSLGSDKEKYSGDITKEGYWVLGVGGTSYPSRYSLEVVDVDPSRPTYLQVVNTQVPLHDENGAAVVLCGADMAWNEKDGNFYLVSSSSFESGASNDFDLFRLDFDDSVEQATMVTQTKVVTTQLVGEGASKDSGAQYFDSEGNFYFYVNESGNLYKIRDDQIIAGGTVTPALIATGSDVTLNDGCGCADVVEFEFGDAPVSYEDPTKPIARHNIVAGKGFYLGSLQDSELEAQNSADALGDDTDEDGDDEDGVTLYGTDFQGQALGTAGSLVSRDYVLTVVASKDGYLNAWLDWNDDGSWGAGEQIFTDEPLSAGINSLVFAVDGANIVSFFPPYDTFARFRFAPAAGVANSTSGVVADGELEDYLVWLGGEADLALTKTVVPTEPVHGGTIVTFTVVVTNSGPYSATGVEVTDRLPSGYSYQDHDASQGTYSSTTGIWKIGTITHNVAVTLEIVAKVGGGDLENVAEVTVSHNPDPDSTPNNHRPEEDDQDSAAVKLLAIGGIVNPVDRVALLTPWIALAVIVVVTGGILLVKRRRACRR